MELEVFKQKTSNLFAENRLLKFGFVALIVITAVNATVSYRLAQSSKTIILPPGAAGRLEVAGATASQDYLVSMARYITNLLGNYTATTARKQFEELLGLFAPETYGEAREKLMNLADAIEKYPTIASVVVWEGNDPLKASDDVIQVATEKHRLADGRTTKVERIVYQIDYQIRGGRFCVLSITTPETKELRRQKEASVKGGALGTEIVHEG